VRVRLIEHSPSQQKGMSKQSTELTPADFEAAKIYKVAQAELRSLKSTRQVYEKRLGRGGDEHASQREQRLGRRTEHDLPSYIREEYTEKAEHSVRGGYS